MGTSVWPGRRRRFSKFQTEHHLNFVMEYCAGGELYELMMKQPNKRFTEAQVTWRPHAMPGPMNRRQDDTRDGRRLITRIVCEKDQGFRCSVGCLSVPPQEAAGMTES